MAVLGGGAVSCERGPSLLRDHPPLGPYSMPLSRALWRSFGGGLLLMSEVALYRNASVSGEGGMWRRPWSRFKNNCVVEM